MIDDQAGKPTGDGQIVTRRQRRLAQCRETGPRHITRHPVEMDLAPGDPDDVTGDLGRAGKLPEAVR